MEGCPNFQNSTVILPTPGVHTFSKYHGGGLLYNGKDWTRTNVPFNFTSNIRWHYI